MKKKTLNKIFSSRVFYIVFSLLVSIALWMFVEINENQIRSHTVRDVPIVRLNEDVLGDRNLLITAMNPESVTLTFSCPRSVASKLTRESLSVVIDLANIKTRGNPMLTFDIDYPPDVDKNSIEEVTRAVSRIMLNVERISSRIIPVTVVYDGGVGEGFIKDTIEYSPQEITISGLPDVIATVSAARVHVLRESLTKTFSDDLQVVLLDEAGNPLDEDIRDQITLSEDTIHVTIPIRAMREVSLNVTLNHGAGSMPENTTYVIDPPRITIAGDPDEVRDYNNINLSSIDMTGFEFSNTYSFPIVLDNRFTNISGEVEATVRVEVHGLEMKYINVSRPGIHVTGAPNGFTVEIRTQSVDVSIRGKQEDLENITESNIRVVADPTQLGLGTHRVPAKVYIDGISGDVGAIGNHPITVSIIRDS